MRILYVYRSLKAGPSIRRVFEPIARELNRQGVAVDSMYLPYQSINPIHLIKNIQCLKKQLKRENYDAVHITGDVYYLLYFLSKYKTVVTVHDLGFYTNFKPSVKTWFLKKFWIDSLLLANLVTFISDKSLKEGLSLIDIPDNKHFVIPNPYDEQFRFVSNRHLDAVPKILHVGTKPNKNLDRVIDALSTMDCTLHIIGPLSNHYKDKLNNSSISYKAESNVSDKDLMDAYENCDVVSFPSLFEGFGMPIIEAQAVGRPIVTSDLSPMKEIAGNAAVLVDPEDVSSIHNGFIEALNRYDELCEKGLKNAENYKVSVIAEKYLKIYKKIINESSIFYS